MLPKTAAFLYGYKLATVAAPNVGSNGVASFATSMKPLSPPKPPMPGDKALQIGGGSSTKVKLPKPPGPNDSQTAFTQGLGTQALSASSGVQSGASMPVGR